ncbi:MAG: hypothetical protein GEU75_04070 [Dehalococcoidia bacterium]|nr:hypothetical protein [Dehalococcoidia bacterium]
MFFVYLKDGRRISIPEAASVIHRSMVIFLDGEDQIVRQIPAAEILAYSRTPYEDYVVEEVFQERVQPQITQVLDSELLMRPRHHRRKALPVSKPTKSGPRIARRMRG